MTWTWEYDPNREYVTKGVPAALVAAVENKAAELVRAADAQYLHGRAYRGFDPKGGNIAVPGGIFTYQIAVRHERVYVLRIVSMG